jgi:hypothetical protein
MVGVTEQHVLLVTLAPNRKVETFEEAESLKISKLFGPLWVGYGGVAAFEYGKYN